MRAQWAAHKKHLLADGRNQQVEGRLKVPRTGADELRESENPIISGVTKLERGAQEI